MKDGTETRLTKITFAFTDCDDITAERVDMREDAPLVMWEITIPGLAQTRIQGNRQWGPGLKDAMNAIVAMYENQGN